MYFWILLVKDHAEKNENEVGTCKAMFQSADDLDDSDIEMNAGIHDSDYTFTPEKSCFNMSMGALNEDWTPLKYQLAIDFESSN